MILELFFFLIFRKMCIWRNIYPTAKLGEGNLLTFQIFYKKIINFLGPEI